MINLRRAGALLGLAIGLAGCTIYNPPPPAAPAYNAYPGYTAYPAYGYAAPAYPYPYPYPYPYYAPAPAFGAVSLGFRFSDGGFHHHHW